MRPNRERDLNGRQLACDLRTLPTHLFDSGVKRPLIMEIKRNIVKTNEINTINANLRD